MATASGSKTRRGQGIHVWIGKRTISSFLFDQANVVLMLMIAVIMLYPVANAVAVSLSRPSAITAGIVSWFPIGLNIEGYRIILAEPMLGITYANTVAYAAVGTVITLLLTSMVSYTLSVKEFVAKKFITLLFAITMFFNGGLVPTYLIIRDLGLLNTFWVMVLPGSVAAYTVFVFRTFFQSTVPDDLRESAFIDGATDIRILFQIYLPLSKPLLATFGLFSVVGHWNRWFEALIYLKDQNRYPVQMLLRRIVIQNNLDSLGEAGASLFAQMTVNPKNVQMAAIVIVLVPIMAIYPFLQKYFVKGVMLGSIKG